MFTRFFRLEYIHIVEKKRTDHRTRCSSNHIRIATSRCLSLLQKVVSNARGPFSAHRLISQAIQLNFRNTQCTPLNFRMLIKTHIHTIPMQQRDCFVLLFFFNGCDKFASRSGDGICQIPKSHCYK